MAKIGIRRRVAVLLGDPGKPDPIKKNERFNQEDFDAVVRLKEALSGLRGYEFIYFDEHESLEKDLKSIKAAAYALNLCDEGLFNNPLREKDIPLMLERLGMQYTGAQARCLTSCYDKSLVKKLAEERGIPVPKSYPLGGNTFRLELKFPLIVKPVYGDGGFGITKKSVVRNIGELEDALSLLKKEICYKNNVMLEEFLSGDEISIGLIGNPPDNYEVLPLIQEDYSSLPPDLPNICGYEAKWDPDSPYWKYLRSVPAELPEKTKKIMLECSAVLFKHLQCRDYARFDWRLNGLGEPKLLEANPNPGWCWDGHMAKMAWIGSIPYPQMLRKILNAAEKRIFNSELQ